MKNTLNDFTHIQIGNSHSFSHDKTSKFITGIKAKICKLLLQAEGEVVLYEEICKYLYSDEPNYFLMRTIDVHICAINKFLSEFNYKATRLRKAGFKLEKLKP